ncbi:MAG: helix-turn-helix domain-containing protein [Clostridiales bacterium]|nr:helix-turn-helix domain-containing protein [Clostridiales bacterium]
MKYMTIQEAAEKWEISERRVQVLCTSNRLPGAEKFGRQWAIPADLEKPDDARVKSGRYAKKRKCENGDTP